MVLLGFGGAPSRTAEGKIKGWAYLEDALVASKGLGEDVTNGAAARQSPPPPAREGRAREESPREGKGSRSRGRRWPCALSGRRGFSHM